MVAHEAVFGWVRRNVAKRGGWRLAPAEMVALLPKAAESAGLSPDSSPPTEACQLPTRRHRGLPSGQDEPHLLINPADASEAEVAEGDRVKCRALSVR